MKNDINIFKKFSNQRTQNKKDTDIKALDLLNLSTFSKNRHSDKKGIQVEIEVSDMQKIFDIQSVSQQQNNF